jgi:hypothetical protein
MLWMPTGKDAGTAEQEGYTTTGLAKRIQGRGTNVGSDG